MPEPSELAELAAIVLRAELLAAGVGGLLERWPVSAPVIRERLADIHAQLAPVRRPVRVERVERALAPCGTEPAYQRHRRRHEPACAACRDAHNDYRRERRRAG